MSYSPFSVIFDRADRYTSNKKIAFRASILEAVARNAEAGKMFRRGAEVAEIR